MIPIKIKTVYSLNKTLHVHIIDLKWNDVKIWLRDQRFLGYITKFSYTKFYPIIKQREREKK